MAFNDVAGMQPRICVCVHLYAYASSVHSCAWVFVRKLCTHALALSDAGVCADEPPSREIMMTLPLGALPSHRSAVLLKDEVKQERWESAVIVEAPGPTATPVAGRSKAVSRTAASVLHKCTP